MQMFIHPPCLTDDEKRAQCAKLFVLAIVRYRSDHSFLCEDVVFLARSVTKTANATCLGYMEVPFNTTYCVNRIRPGRSMINVTKFIHTRTINQCQQHNYLQEAIDAFTEQITVFYLRG